MKYLGQSKVETETVVEPDDDVYNSICVGGHLGGVESGLPKEFTNEGAMRPTGENAMDACELQWKCMTMHYDAMTMIATIPILPTGRYTRLVQYPELRRRHAASTYGASIQISSRGVSNPISSLLHRRKPSHSLSRAFFLPRFSVSSRSTPVSSSDSRFSSRFGRFRPITFSFRFLVWRSRLFGVCSPLFPLHFRTSSHSGLPGHFRPSRELTFRLTLRIPTRFSFSGPFSHHSLHGGRHSTWLDSPGPRDGSQGRALTTERAPVRPGDLPAGDPCSAPRRPASVPELREEGSHTIRGYGNTGAREWYDELPDAVRRIVDRAGFSTFCRGLSRLSTCRPLLAALAERWWDTTDSFHFSAAGDMTMTPYDFSMLIGIGVGGDPIPFDTNMDEWTAAQVHLLGEAPPLARPGFVRYSWFEVQFRVQPALEEEA
ncbi:hypothetical protein HYC85_029260 [Camellia sinensis]|uniref:Aminotransferase-like plant mobile domain-containing protein n=1 Tax=Camellia sinensis TaxID=4442 RepID=A0A7J7FXR1_CAMSI|nr:hypothetical protein HYC85_029260 [Camellia sinensis]